MRKYLSITLCILALLLLSVPALAAEDGPPSWIFPSEEQEEPDPEPELPSEPDPPTVTEMESAGTEDDNNSGTHAAEPVAPGPDDKYPVGSYIDAAGRVWSQSGTLLSPDAAQAVAETPLPALPPDVPDAALDRQPLAVTPEEITLELLYNALEEMSEEVSAPGTAYVVDLRPKEETPVVLSGLKALVTSVFGEYKPIRTNTVVSQTVGSDTYQYLVETVAPGSAGVDYEWVAGVVLFAILLYCLMRLLGGVLK